MNKKENFLKGFIKENPLFVLLLGTCPALAVTDSLSKAVGMTLAFVFVMVLSNLIISLINSNAKIKELIQPVRIAVYIVIIASLVTIVEMLMSAYLPDLYSSLGVFISLITVNCIVLGRAEAYASSNKVSDSIIDGLSMGLGYGLAIIIIAFVRELLGNWSITLWADKNINIGVNFYELIKNGSPDVYNFLVAQGIGPISFFTSSAGAFLVLGIILAIMQAIKNSKEEKAKALALKAKAEAMKAKEVK